MAREDLNEMMNEIRQNGGFSPNEISLIEKAIQGFLDRRHSRYRYYDFFHIATGKQYGGAMEARIIKTFRGFKKPMNDTSFDAWSSQGEKVEIKSLRACTKEQERIFLKEDAISPSRFSTSSYQQTKPSCCEWFVYHILFGDGSRLFVIPSKMISARPGKNNAENGKIPLSIQHRNHATEGQVNLGQVIKYARYFEISDYDLEGVYDFSKFQKQIVERMNEINWCLPK